MLTTSLRRLASAVLTLFISSVVIFTALRLVPGDPVLALTAGRRLTPEQIAALRDEYGFDRPFLAGYLDWLAGAVHFDLGTSLSFQTQVSSLIGSRLAVSGLLIGYAVLLTVSAGLAVALVSAVRGGAVDRAGLYLTSIATATPPFVSAIVLVALFSVQLRWFPALGGGSGFGDRLHHLTLPAVALAASSFGVLARLARSSFVEELRREHVEVARSRGVPLRLILWRHVVRNGMAPVLTLIAILVASLFVGTAVVETAFGLDGVGSLLVVSVARRDVPVVQGIAWCTVTLFVVTGTIVDLVLPLLDPRLRVRRAAA